MWQLLSPFEYHGSHLPCVCDSSYRPGCAALRCYCFLPGPGSALTVLYEVHHSGKRVLYSYHRVCVAAHPQGPCPVCAKLTSRMTRHISLTHGPHGPGVDERTGVYALAVVRRPSDGKFLLVQVRTLWYSPSKRTFGVE